MVSYGGPKLGHHFDNVMNHIEEAVGSHFAKGGFGILLDLEINDTIVSSGDIIRILYNAGKSVEVVSIWPADNAGGAFGSITMDISTDRAILPLDENRRSRLTYPNILI